jgi:hypothetical protein
MSTEAQMSMFGSRTVIDALFIHEWRRQPFAELIDFIPIIPQSMIVCDIMEELLSIQSPSKK